MFLVDDHPIVRWCLRLLVNPQAGMEVCGEENSASDAYEKIVEVEPDVAIVDLRLADGGGLELIRRLRAEMSRLKILVFTTQDDSFYVQRALRAGADGYLTKDEGAEQVVVALRSLLNGKPYMTRKIAAWFKETVDCVGRGNRRDGTDGLSNREVEVLEMIGGGLSTREIAEKLTISVKTVEAHREHMKTKLGLNQAAQLVRYAFNWVRE